LVSFRKCQRPRPQSVADIDGPRCGSPTRPVEDRHIAPEFKEVVRIYGSPLFIMFADGACGPRPLLLRCAYLGNEAPVYCRAASQCRSRGLQSGCLARQVDRPSKRRVARHSFEGSGPDAAKSAFDKPAWHGGKAYPSARFLGEVPGIPSTLARGQGPGDDRAGRSCARQVKVAGQRAQPERPAPPLQILGGRAALRGYWCRQ
jgi:hypothetical protein